MIIASVIIIALALTAVSGITYSWFSDTEQSKIDVSTAVVDFEPTYTVSSNSSIGTTLTKGALTDGVQAFTLENLAANQQFTIISDIDNKSTVKTVYRMYATWETTEDASITNYDIQNISINGKYLTVAEATPYGGSSDAPAAIITDWTLLAAEADPTPTNITIATPTTYGDKTDDGYALPDGSSYTTGWDTKTARSGLTINIVIEAYQGDYPYEPMKVTNNTATATIPANKVVKADVIKYTETGTASTQEVTNVVMDFSNAATYTTSSDTTTKKDIAGTTIKTEVTGISTTSETTNVSINLSLYEGSSTTPVTSPTFTNPVVITMTVPGELSDPKVVYNETGTDGTVLSSTINSDSTTTVVFSVDHFSNYTIKQDNGAESKWELQKALAAGGYVKLGSDISDVSVDIEVTSDATLDLNGYDVTFSSNNTDESNWNIKVAKGASLTVTGTDASAVTFSKTWGFRVYGNLTINGDATFKNPLSVKDGSVVVGTREESGATATINGGTFIAAEDGVAVYTFPGTINIYGGSFSGTTDVENGKLLNQNNGNPGTITVYGGTFTNYDPSTGDDKSAEYGTATTFVAKGYVSVLKEGKYEVHLLNPSYADGDTVSDGINSYATLVEALEGIHNTGLDTLWCKKGADVGSMTHGHVCSDLTIIGNGACVSGGERDFAPGISHVLTSDVTLTVKDLNGCAAWGYGANLSTYTLTLVFENCQNMNRIYFDGQGTGTINATVTDCSFVGTATGTDYGVTAIKYDPVGTLTITNTKFSDYIVAINMKNDGTSNGTGKFVQNIKITGCTFTDCGTKEWAATEDEKEKDKKENEKHNYSAWATAIRVVAENSNSTTNLTTSGNVFSYSNGKTMNIADMALGDLRPNKTSNGTIIWTGETTISLDASPSSTVSGRSDVDGTFGTSSTVRVSFWSTDTGSTIVKWGENSKTIKYNPVTDTKSA